MSTMPDLTRGVLKFIESQDFLPKFTGIMGQVSRLFINDKKGDIDKIFQCVL